MGKSIFTIIRKLSIGGLYFTACFIIAFVFFIKSNIPQDTLKQLIEAHLQKQIGRHISIESVSGNLLNTITLNNVSIFLDTPQNSRATIQTLSFNISLLSILANKGNLLYGLNSLDISGLTLFLTRLEDGSWELASLYPSKKNTSKPLFPLKTHITLNNSAVFFRDERGWDKDNVSTPFEESINLSQIDIMLDTTTISSINITGTLHSNNSSITAHGSIDLQNMLFDFNFLVDSLSINHWSRYILPIQDVSIEENDIRLSGILSNRDTSPSSSLPFSYELQATLHKNDLILSFIPAPIHIDTGQLRYYQNNSSVQPILDISNLHGNIAKIPFTGDGQLLIYDSLIHLQGETKSTSITHLYTLFPDLADLELSGLASSSIVIDGPISNPSISGQVLSDTFTLFSYAINTSIIDYLYKDSIFYYTLHKGTLFNTPIQGKGKIDLTSDRTKFRIQTTAKQVNTHTMHSSLYPIQIDVIDTTISGYKEDYTISSIIKAPTSYMLNQTVPQSKLQFRIKDNILHSALGEAYINSDKSIISIASTSSGNTINIMLKGVDLAINDIEPSANYLTTGSLSITSTISLENTYPFTIKQASLQALSTQFPYQNALFSEFTLDTIYINNLFKINTFTLKNTEEKISLDGEIKDLDTGSLHVNFDKLNIKNHTLIQDIIPETAKPFTGLLSGDVWFKPKKHEDYIFNYAVSGNLQLKNPTIQNQPIDTIDVTFYADETLNIQNFELLKNESILKSNGTITKESFDFNIDSSLFSLQDFKTLLFQYGNYSGTIGGTGHLYGTLSNPQIDLQLDISNLKTNYMSLSKLQGHINYSNEKLTLKNIELQDTHTQVTINGFMQKAPLYTPPVIYSFDFDIQKLDIEPFTLFLQNVVKEYQGMTQITVPLKEEEIPNSNITSSLIKNNYEISFDMSSGILFSLQEMEQALAHFKTIQLQKKETDSLKAPTKENPISGLLTGSIQLQSQPADIPKIDGNVTITDFKIPYAKTDVISLTAVSKPSHLSYILETGKGIIASREFESIKTNGTLDYTGLLTIKKTELKGKHQLNSNIIHGTFPLTSLWKSPLSESILNLTLQLEKNDINLLSFIHPSISSITNDGTLTFHLGGPINRPILTAPSLELVNASLTFNDSVSLIKEIKIPSSTLKIANNKLLLSDTLFQWKGLDKEKKKSVNAISVNGFLELTSFSLINPDQIDFFMELYTGKSSFSVTIPEFYTGEVMLSPLSIIGTYTIPISQKAIDELQQKRNEGKETGPLISGRIDVKNGNFELPKHINTEIYPSLLFNLDIDIKKDIFVSGSFFGSGSLAAISVDLETEETIKPLRLIGTINSPRIENKIQFKDGNINIFNREFSLLSYSDQAQYTSQVGGELLPNEIYFSNSLNAYGQLEFIPVLNLSSVTVVDQGVENISSENNTIEEEYAHVVSKISGSITNLSTIRFDYYSSSLDNIKNNNDLSYVQSYYISNGKNQNTADKGDRTALLKLLFPELFSDSSNQLLSEYGETRVNLMFKRSVLRPIEKQIANGIGLYDLKIDYDLGSDLFNANNSQSVGINMMQQLFRDQLYLRVKTDIELEAETQTAGNSVGISEIELTYYLLKNFSLNYANIKEDINTDTNFRPKVSLKFSHEF